MTIIEALSVPSSFPRRKAWGSHIVLTVDEVGFVQVENYIIPQNKPYRCWTAPLSKEDILADDWECVSSIKEALFKPKGKK